MNLWDFLTWLWNGAAKVLDWFGDQYNSFRDKIANFWYYLGRWATDIYNTVWNWIRDQVDLVRSEVLSWYNSLVAWLNSIGSWIDAAIADVRSWVDGFVRPLLNQLWDTVTEWVRGVWDGIIAWVEGIPAWVSDQLEYVKGWVIGLVEGILPLVDKKDKLFVLTDDNFFTQLIDLIQSGYKQLRLFLDNPTGYILNIIADKALDFIGDVIGYGLGSVDTELPDKRDWSK